MGHMKMFWLCYGRAITRRSFPFAHNHIDDSPGQRTGKDMNHIVYREDLTQSCPQTSFEA
jgi:hypothetical protein